MCFVDDHQWQIQHHRARGTLSVVLVPFLQPRPDDRTFRRLCRCPHAQYDALVVGAGGAGLRAAFGLAEAGLKVSRSCPPWLNSGLSILTLATVVQRRPLASQNCSLHDPTP